MGPDEKYICVYGAKMCALCVVEVEIGQSTPGRMESQKYRKLDILSLGGEKFVSFYEAPCYKNRPPFLAGLARLVDV